MSFRLLLVGTSLLLTGCVYHHQSAAYNATAGESAVYVENRKVYVALRPTTQGTSHDLGKFSGRLSAVVHNSYVATGPYSLLVLVTTKGVENGVSVEITSAELRFATGETRTILSRSEPPRKGITQQRLARGKHTPTEEFSRCDFVFPLGDQLIFKADERVRVVVSARIAGLREEVNVDVEFKGTSVDEWGSTLRQI